MALSIAGWRLRIADWRLPVVLALLLGSTVGSTAAGESTAQRAERLRQMTDEQRNELLSKKRRFDDLKPEEKDRYHALHAAIETADESTELQQTLDRYHAWLGTLSSGQRAELRDLPADKRIERIKELLKQQEVQRFQAFVGNLGDSDRSAIFRWLGEFVTAHEDEILDLLPERDRDNIRSIPDQESRQRALGIVMAMQRQNPRMPAPNLEDFNRLMDSLSSTTVAQIEQAPAVEQPDRIREMVGAAIFSRRTPPVSDEDLRKFYNGLKADQREKLEGLEPEEFKRRLTWIYHSEKRGWQPGRGPWPGGGGFGPPGPGRPPGDGPRGEGQRGEGQRGEGRRGGGRSDDGPPGDRRPKGPPPDDVRPMPPSSD